jgi:uncharacterized protein YecE (DUF72 family)
VAKAWIGISGYDYPGWRGVFYPEGLAKRRWLEFASRAFNSVEINGTFYSLKSPSVFARWRDDVPARGFIFAIKGGRFITHNLKLRNCDAALGNFFASGVLALGRATGPFLWQLPATYAFDASRMEDFMQRLPRNAAQGEAVALQHDHRLARGALVTAAAPVRYRHAFEVRHPSYFCDEFYDLLRRNHCALVIADTAGKFGYAEHVTANFVYVRLHGSRELYVSGYTDEELDRWAALTHGWLADGKDVYVYFDNDAKVCAPADARRLRERIDQKSRGRST